MALLDRRAGHVQRALDGALGLVVHTRRRVDRVQAQVEEVVEAQPRGDQPGLSGRAQLVEPADRGPVLVRSDVQVVDRLEQVRHDAMDDMLGARVALVAVESADGLQEALDYRGIEDLDAHACTSLRLLYVDRKSTRLNSSH